MTLTIARALTFPALLLAAVGCSYYWSEQVELNPLELELGAEAVEFIVEAKLTSDEGEVLPCGSMVGSVTGAWGGDLARFTVTSDDAMPETHDLDDRMTLPLGSGLTIEDAGDGSCALSTHLSITTDTEVSGALTLTVTLENAGSGPDGVPDGDTTLEGNLVFFTE